ncbi:MAG: Holliday junction branch migration DNA helicase RuvB [Collinsella sp.]|nr:Holliday junction branch migration DNA helicase RuvB [Collinsella sp.]
MWEADDSQDLWATSGNSPAASMAHGERMVGSELTPEDLDVDRTLRPQRLDDYCGQEHIKQSLRVLIEAAQSRGETLDHVIFSGPPGLGKTTLATVIANELGAQIKTTNLQPGDVLFIDEIHRLNRSVEEVLYPAMEDFALDIVIGKGPAARSIRLDIPKFTLVAATTRSGMLTGPLRDRFGISYRLDYYTVEELAQIVTRSATILGVAIDHPSALEIGSRSRGTPRLANRLLKRVRDYAQVRGNGPIELDICRQALEFFEIDELGLDWMDIRILETLAKTFSGRAVGLTTLASAVGEDPGTLEDVYEPYLLQCGLMIRTPQGRQATLRTFEHLGIEPTV